MNSGGHSSSSAACGGLCFATLRVVSHRILRWRHYTFLPVKLWHQVHDLTAYSLLLPAPNQFITDNDQRLLAPDTRAEVSVVNSLLSSADGAELVTAVFNTEQRLQGRSIVCSLTFAPSSTTCPQSLSDSGSLALYACGALSSATVNKLRNRRPALICINLQGQRLFEASCLAPVGRRHNTFI